MAIRLIDPPLNDTNKLIESIFKVVLYSDEHADFLMPNATNRDAMLLLARIRVMISKLRKKRQQRGLLNRHFKLCSKVSEYKQDEHFLCGQCIEIWVTVTNSHTTRETIEELLSNG